LFSPTCADCLIFCTKSNISVRNCVFDAVMFPAVQLQITEADFELTKHVQEKAKLRSKYVKSPVKVQVRPLPFCIFVDAGLIPSLAGYIYSVT
jgi:hypothetical protein